jgi:hypothetical protein
LLLEKGSTTSLQGEEILTSLLICFHGLKLFKLFLTLFFCADPICRRRKKKKKESTLQINTGLKIEVMVVQTSKGVQFGVGLFFDFC